jgi:hypothetical protein
MYHTNVVYSRKIGIAFSSIDAVQSFTSTIGFTLVFAELSDVGIAIFIQSLRTIAKELFIAIVIHESRDALY